MYPANITRAEAGVRSQQIRTHSYQVLVDLSEDGFNPATEPGTLFTSTSTVRFTSTGGSSHLDPIAETMVVASLDGVPLAAESFVNHKIHFTAPPGEHEITVTAQCRYSRTGEGLHRFVDPVDDRVYCYSQFETADARRMYACFEQPDLKATFALTVIAPSEWTVLTNAAPVTPLPHTEGFSRWSFPATPPISTYITALVAGPFHTLTSTHDGIAGPIELSLSCRQSLVPQLDAERLFAVTKGGFEVFEKHFGRHYPFVDYAQIFVPEFNAGAMENAGCVTIRDEYLYRSRVTNAAFEARDNTILHELAHMWFGDLVTMTWWDDLWLNESFAEWASHFAQAEIRRDGEPGDDPWATFANSRKSWAYAQDQLPTTHPVAADMVDLAAVELNFDGITYAKGASVLRQLVAFVGEEPFLAGIRAYFAEHAWGNTQLSDLLDALSVASGRDLSHFATQWLQTSGVNTIWAEFDLDENQNLTRFAIRQAAPPTWPTLRRHRLAVGFYQLAGGVLARTHRVEVDIDTNFTEIPELAGLPRPDLILLNDDDLTYTKIRLDPRSMHTVVNHLGELADPLARALLWAADWDMCRDAELAASDYVNLVLGAVGVETDLTAVGAVLDQGRFAIDNYAAPHARNTLNDTFVTGLAQLLKQAAPASDHQVALARALIKAAQTPATVDLLQAWLTGTEVPVGLAIDTDMRWLIVTNLARLGVIDEAMIAAESDRDPTAQGAERAAGARAALPGADAKEAAWRAATADPGIANETHFQIVTNFFQRGQDEVLRPYLERYLAVVEDMASGTAGWAERGSAIRLHTLSWLFPRPLVDTETMGILEAWRQRSELPDFASRPVDERLDDARRALRAQAFDQRLRG